MERKNTLLTAGLTLAIAVGSLSGCATAPTKAAAPSQPAPAAKQEANAPKQAAASAGPVLAGKVVETMDGGGYTYVLLEKDGKQGWSAIPQTSVKVGDNVVLIPGIDMGNFRSNALKRNFENIHFSAGIQDGAGKAEAKPAAPAGAAAPAEGAAALPPGHPPLPKGNGAKAPAPAAAAPAAAPETISGKVVEAMNAGGYTYLNLEKGGKKTWVAIPQEDVAVDSQVSVESGSVMPSFSSKSLKRTFENIIFSPGLVK
ncbi:hypothetical protein LPW11_02280 [Geomonas sp. RF6]|uniref:hypothetical protein n=1 Tax=Geomonas sp. RF6 TaxID=2897342 RepID=UPI001E41CBA3|nr:hypothetical protein [Geomonas sp. RF6]UFS71025.1 hypothetical protein LPW11_02280 [Geomonas sp. RF6]